MKHWIIEYNDKGIIKTKILCAINEWSARIKARALFGIKEIYKVERYEEF